MLIYDNRFPVGEAIAGSSPLLQMKGELLLIARQYYPLNRTLTLWRCCSAE
jgi:hypothetical protein